MSTTVRVKNGRMLTIRQIERDKPQALPQRDLPDDRPPQQFPKARKKFSAKKNRPSKDHRESNQRVDIGSFITEGNRVGDIKKLDAKGRLTPEERVKRLIELADRFGPEYLENEKLIHQRKVFEIEEALRRHKNARTEINQPLIHED